MAEGKQKPSDTVTSSGAGEMTEKEIDDNLEGTFQASDPPSWTLGTDHRDEPTEKESDSQQEDELPEE